MRARNSSTSNGTRSCRRAVGAAAVVAALVLAGNAFAQTPDTVRIRFRVNEASGLTTVKAVLSPGATADGDCVGMERNVAPRASGRDTVYAVSKSGGGVSVRHGSRRPSGSAMIVSQTRGNVSLMLQPQQYGEASVSLHTVNGKRILHGDASASKGAFGVSRQNVAPGVYLLSVKGADGNAFSAKVAHSGGRLNISASFAGENRSLAKQTAVSDCGTWTLKLSADGFRDTTININLSSPDIGSITLNREIVVVPPQDLPGASFKETVGGVGIRGKEPY